MRQTSPQPVSSAAYQESPSTRACSQGPSLMTAAATSAHAFSRLPHSCSELHDLDLRKADEAIHR
jgi:hypothetical protein